MKIGIAGENVTKALSDDLQNLADSREHKETAVMPESLGLKEAHSENEYAGKHIEILRTRCAVDTSKVEVPGTGAIRMIRGVFWKFLRPVFDWMAYNQNSINEQIVHAMEMEKRQRDRQVLELKNEIAELRKKT